MYRGKLNRKPEEHPVQRQDRLFPPLLSLSSESVCTSSVLSHSDIDVDVRINIPESQPILNISKYATKCVLACSPHCMCVCGGGGAGDACMRACVCVGMHRSTCVYVCEHMWPQG